MEQDCVNAGTIAKLCDKIQKLESERDALKAHVERLVKACELAINSHGRMLMSDPPQEAWKYHQVETKLVEAIAATPQQSLAEHDAEVITKFIYKLVEMGNIDSLVNETTGDNYLYVGGILQFSNEYAKRIKDGE